MGKIKTTKKNTIRPLTLRCIVYIPYLVVVCLLTMLLYNYENNRWIDMLAVLISLFAVITTFVELYCTNYNNAYQKRKEFVIEIIDNKRKVFDDNLLKIIKKTELEQYLNEEEHNSMTLSGKCLFLEIFLIKY